VAEGDSTIKHSATVNLATQIEVMTGSTWNQEKRFLVAELIRKYRFEQVGSVLLRIQTLIRETGNKDLSEKIFMGRF
jgi:hypothetical protein